VHALVGSGKFFRIMPTRKDASDATEKRQSIAGAFLYKNLYREDCPVKIHFAHLANAIFLTSVLASSAHASQYVSKLCFGGTFSARFNLESCTSAANTINQLSNSGISYQAKCTLAALKDTECPSDLSEPTIAKLVVTVIPIR
jgi:hypothetical protein